MWQHINQLHIGRLGWESSRLGISILHLTLEELAHFQHTLKGMEDIKILKLQKVKKNIRRE